MKPHLTQRSLDDWRCVDTTGGINPSSDSKRTTQITTRMHVRYVSNHRIMVAGHTAVLLDTTTCQKLSSPSCLHQQIPNTIKKIKNANTQSKAKVVRDVPPRDKNQTLHKTQPTFVSEKQMYRRFRFALLLAYTQRQKQEWAGREERRVVSQPMPPPVPATLCSTATPASFPALSLAGVSGN